uniref:Uncharacterized protein n=1 Tax=Oryza barthii TaxID=65489 RepID=A0A0D3HCU9_9ORYZ
MGNDVGVEAVEAPSTTQRGALARQLRASTAASSVGASAVRSKRDMGEVGRHSP